jgi:hypothetical protein
VQIGSSGKIQVGYSGSSYGPYQTNQGGEFTYNPYTGWLDLSGYNSNAATKTKNIGVGGTFQTFCIEGGEYLYGFDNKYDAVISTKAMDGGVTPAGQGDPISVGTGWLYSQFAQGTLANFHYQTGRAGSTGSSADLLQKAIWWLEGEESISYNSGNIFMSSVVNYFGALHNLGVLNTLDKLAQAQAFAKADGGSTYGVYAINMYQSGNLRQDGLYYHPVPDGGATIMLLGLALGGISLISSRLRA